MSVTVRRNWGGTWALVIITYGFGIRFLKKKRKNVRRCYFCVSKAHESHLKWGVSRWQSSRLCTSTRHLANSHRRCTHSNPCFPSPPTQTASCHRRDCRKSSWSSMFHIELCYNSELLASLCFSNLRQMLCSPIIFSFFEVMVFGLDSVKTGVIMNLIANGI